MVNDSLWEVSDDNQVVFDSTFISIKDLGFHNKKQEIRAFGTISSSKDDKLNLTMREFNIANLNILTKPKGFEFRGTISGKLE